MGSSSKRSGNGNGNGNVRGEGRGNANGRGSMIIPGSLEEHSSVSSSTSSKAGNEEQPGSTATESITTTTTATTTTTTTTITITTTTKRKRTKPQNATIASMITVDDMQNSEHRLCGFLDPLCVHIHHKGTLPGTNKQVCVVCGKACQHEICGICKVALHYTNTSPGWLACSLLLSIPQHKLLWTSQRRLEDGWRQEE
jgi:hypothetical protein